MQNTMPFQWSGNLPEKIINKALSLLIRYNNGERSLARRTTNPRTKYIVINVGLYRLVQMGTEFTLMTHERYNKIIDRK